MSLGNDVVDLNDPEAQPQAIHARFDERVFGPEERSAIEGSESPHVLRWALWAAKESAYKARKRQHPKTVFSPRSFVISPMSLTARAGLHRCQASHQGSDNRFEIELRLTGESVHAVARAEPVTGTRLLLRLQPLGSADPSAAVRRLAAAAIARALELAPADIAIHGRPPLVHFRQLRLDATLSLSHHGRFVAFACALPQPVTLAVGAPDTAPTALRI